MRAYFIIGLVCLAATFARADGLFLALDTSSPPLGNGDQVITAYQGTASQLVTGSIVDPADGPAVDDLYFFSLGLIGGTDAFNPDTNSDGGAAFFDSNGPTGSLSPSQTSADFDLFTITNLSFAPVGTYLWSYDLYDGNGGLAGSGDFEVDVEAPVAPEPGSMSLIGVGFAVAAVFQRRRIITALHRSNS